MLLSLRILNQLSFVETSQHPGGASAPNESLVLVDFSLAGAIVLGLMLRDATSEGKPRKNWMLVERPQDTIVGHFKMKIPGREREKDA